MNGSVPSSAYNCCSLWVVATNRFERFQRPLLTTLAAWATRRGTCRQHTSLTFAPASASFQHPDDLLLANLARFISAFLSAGP